MLKADGFDKAFLGVASRFGMDEVFAYDYDNPNTGYRYLQPVRRRNKDKPQFIAPD